MSLLPLRESVSVIFVVFIEAPTLLDRKRQMYPGVHRLNADLEDADARSNFWSPVIYGSCLSSLH
jgi:hypothetical protein